jgi:Mn-dependent DtxR family transcriptional regulator
MTKTQTHLGDECLAALEALGGEANTDDIAREVRVGPISALCAMGRLGKKGLVVKCEKGNKKGNPRWRLPVIGEEGFEQ